MKKSARWMNEGKYDAPGEAPSRRLSFFKFFLRYPIFVLAFGPPLFRSPEGIDATKGKIDIWSFIQVGLLAIISSRAIWRISSRRSIFLPKQIRSILRYTFFLGVLYLISVAYSPSRPVSAAYSIIYFSTWICVVEFVADIYINPPNWLQCLFILRRIAFLLLLLDIVVIFWNPELVLAGTGFETRFTGGTVGPSMHFCPIVAIISAYFYLYSQEPRARSIFFFLFGLVGTFLSRSRGCELALLLSLAILGYFWAKLGRRTSFIVISGLMATTLLSALLVGTVGGGRISDFVNRGQDIKGIESASGRTVVWNYIIQYCIAHPWGMGFVAGFRMLFRNYYALGLTLDVRYIGAAHNSFFQVLADAGWLALAIYLIMLVKVVRLALHFAKKQTYLRLAPDNYSRMAIECSLVILAFFFAVGMVTSAYTTPLSGTFYSQNIIIAIILGASARMIAASRTRPVIVPSDV